MLGCSPKQQWLSRQRNDFLRHNNGGSCLHSGCHTLILSRFCWASYEHQRRATGLYTCLAYDKWYHGVSPTTISIMQGIFRNGYFLLFFHLFHYKCRFANQLLTILRFTVSRFWVTKICIACLTSIKLTISKRIVQPLLCSSCAPIGLILYFYVFVFYVDIYLPTSRRCRT